MDAPCGTRSDGEAENDGQSLGATLADCGSSPFELAADQELRGRVDVALRQVPEVFRTVVVLREIEGFTYEEIADILRVNLGTVKSRLTRGRAALRGLLAPESPLSNVEAGVPHRAVTPIRMVQHASRTRGHGGSLSDPVAETSMEGSL